MPHPCQDGNWTIAGGGNRVNALRDLVKTENQRQAQAGCEVGAWAYWLQEADFAIFRTVFDAIAVALDTPVVPPGPWTGGPVPPPGHPDLINMVIIPPETSSTMGAGAQEVLSVLQYDEAHVVGTPPTPVHPEQGTPGWLGSGAPNPIRYREAEKLFTVMRHALDR